jgi:hypothetical protein
MQIDIISAGLGVVLFFIAFMGFKQGLRLGMKTAKGELPKPIRSPAEIIKETVQEVREIKEDHEHAKAAKKFEEDMERFMSYTGDTDDE